MATLLDAGAGPMIETLESRLFRTQVIRQVGTEKAQKPREKTEVFAAPECKDAAAKVAAAMGLPPQSVQPLTWKSQRGVVVAAAAMSPGNEELFTALHTDNVAGVRAALARGVELDVMDPKQPHLPALELAAKRGSVETARLLLDHGFAVQGLSRQNRPLSVAAAGGHVKVMELLLERGASPEDEDPFQRPLCQSRHQPEAFKLLIARGAKIDALCKASSNGTPELLLSMAAGAGDIPFLKRLLEAGANPNAVDFQPPLFHASTPEAARVLLAAGAKVDARDEDGDTVLHVYNHHTPEFMSLLLEAGADPRAVNQDGWTALHTAVLEAKDTEVLELLVKKGAPINAVSTRPVEEMTMKGDDDPWVARKGSTALDVAVVSENSAAAEALDGLGGKQRTTKGQPLP
ncbi:MAG TPA: ankyrin repeat domain-containing protein [Myxococcaceae bacterium]|jgi:ankyrin repeat protein